MPMNYFYDMLVVFLYFAIVFIAGIVVSRRFKGETASDFLTGGKNLNWFQTGLTLIAMSIDTGIMGVAGVGFVWGMSIHPNAANLWITAPLAAMFLIPIYWRSKIVTTPELLEKRFNVASRAFFSVIMTVYMVIVMGTSIYLGSLIMTEIFNWPLWLGAAVIMLIVGVYVIMGGMKTILRINIYQSIFITLTLVAVAVVMIYRIGGLGAFASIKEVNQAGQVLPSTLLEIDWKLNSKSWYPLPEGLLWAGMAGAAWIACNFGMAQRLLAAKNEKHAQKAILFTGAGHVFTFLLAYAIGVCIHVLVPELDNPDASYMRAVLEYFPSGVRGILIAGLLASLLSTIDGLLSASSTLITSDVYLRFIRPGSSDKNTKKFARIIQAVIIIAATLIIPVAAKSTIIMGFIQSLVADLFGVIIALFLVGIFSTRATPKAAFYSMLFGTLLAVILDVSTDMNFAWVGVFSFTFSVLATIFLSYFEKPMPREQLRNLTIFTLDGTKGPWVGLKAWPALWKWIIGIFVGWHLLVVAWEIIIRQL